MRRPGGRQGPGALPWAGPQGVALGNGPGQRPGERPRAAPWGNGRDCPAALGMAEDIALGIQSLAAGGEEGGEVGGGEARLVQQQAVHLLEDERAEVVAGPALLEQ